MSRCPARRDRSRAGLAPFPHPDRGGRTSFLDHTAISRNPQRETSQDVSACPSTAGRPESVSPPDLPSTHRFKPFHSPFCHHASIIRLGNLGKIFHLGCFVGKWGW